MERFMVFLKDRGNMKKVFINVMVLCFAIVSFATISPAEIKVGINSPRGELKAMKQWGEFGNYLSAELGQPVTVVPVAVANIIDAIQEGNLDFVLANPVQTIILQEKHGVSPLVTLNKKSGSQFAGVIIARKGSGITKVVDLKGKKVISLKHGASAGAYLFQTYHLDKQGINAHKDFTSFQEGKKQDDLVLTVKAGLFDAAFIRTGILEAMSQEGKISMDEFVVVDQRTDPGLDLVHTTVPYPEWFLSATTKADPAITAQLKKATLKMTPETKAAKTANINGFVEALSLEGLREAMKALKIPPFNN